MLLPRQERLAWREGRRKPRRRLRPLHARRLMPDSSPSAHASKATGTPNWRSRWRVKRSLSETPMTTTGNLCPRFGPQSRDTCRPSSRTLK